MPASLAAHARRAHLQSQPRQQEQQAVTSRQVRRASLGITGAVEGRREASRRRTGVPPTTR